MDGNSLMDTNRNFFKVMNLFSEDIRPDVRLLTNQDILKILSMKKMRQSHYLLSSNFNPFKVFRFVVYFSIEDFPDFQLSVQTSIQIYQFQR